MEGMGAFRMLTGKPTGNRPLEMPRHRWEGNARMNIKEIVDNAMNWIDSAKDRDCWRAVVNVALNLCVP
jgi:hypothetical protein